MSNVFPRRPSSTPPLHANWQKLRFPALKRALSASSAEGVDSRCRGKAKGPFFSHAYSRAVALWVHPDPFTVSEADASGISRGRLRHARITRLSRSIRWVDSQDLADLQSMPPHRRYRAYTQVTPYSVASHYSAAEVWEFPLPSFADDGKLHITRLTGMSPQRRDGVSGHTGQMFAGEICVVEGLSLTSRERTWLDLSQRLTVPDLTVIADYLIRIPRPEYENRTTPYATMESLQEVIDRHTGKRGIRKARLALDLSRMGADSPNIPPAYGRRRRGCRQ